MFERSKKVLRILRKTIVYGFVLFVALIVGIFLILQSIDPNTYKGIISKQVYNATGRELKIKGDLKWDLFSMNPGIIIENVEFENAQWSKEKNMVTVGEMEANISLRELFFRKIYIKEFRLIEPKILLEVNKKGETNWAFKPIEKKLTKEEIQKKQEKEAKEKEAKEKAKRAEKSENDDKSDWFTFEIGVVEDLVIKDGNLKFVNHKTNKTENLAIHALTLHAKTFASPIELYGSITYNDLPISFNVNVGSVTDIIMGGKFNIDASLETLTSNLAVNGYINDILKLNYIDLNITANAKALHEELKAFKMDLPNIPEINLDTKIEGNLEHIEAKNIDLSVGRSDIKGDIDATLKGKPSINASLNSDLIDLTQFIKVKAKDQSAEELSDEAEKALLEKEEGPHEKLFDKTPLPAKELNLINYTLEGNFNKIKINEMVELKDTKLTSTLKDGNLALNTEFDAEQGNGNLSLKADASSKKYIDAELSLTGSKIKTAKIIQSMIPKNPFSGGEAETSIYLKSYGQTVNEFAGNLDGQILLNNTSPLVGKNIGGALLGKSFLDVFFRSFEDENTKFKCFVTNLYAIDGVIYSNRGIATETDNPDINFVIDGSINLKEEKMDLAMIPTTRDTFKLDLNSIYNLIRIKGNLQDPQIILSGSTALRDTITETAKVLFFSAITGGIAGGILSQQLFNKVTADENPCQTALNTEIDEEYLKDINSRYRQSVDKRSSSEILQDKAKEEIDKAKEEVKKKIEEKKEKAKKKVKKEIKKETEKVKKKIEKDIQDKIKEKLNFSF